MKIDSFTSIKWHILIQHHQNRLIHCHQVIHADTTTYRLIHWHQMTHVDSTSPKSTHSLPSNGTYWYSIIKIDSFTVIKWHILIQHHQNRLIHWHQVDSATVKFYDSEFYDTSFTTLLWDANDTEKCDTNSLRNTDVSRRGCSHTWKPSAVLTRKNATRRVLPAFWNDRRNWHGTHHLPSLALQLGLR